MSVGFSRRATAALLAVSALVVDVAAHYSPQHFAEAHAANQAALRQFTWKSRTELRLAGDVKQVRLEQVRFGLDGQVQKTAIGGESSASASRPGPPGPAGAIKKHVVARKTEAFKEMLADLGRLAESYSHMSPQQRLAFASHATVTPGQGSDTGSLRLSGRDVVIAGDHLTIWIDPASGAARRIEIATSYEGDAVTIAADYRRLPAGPTYQARSVLRHPAKQLDVTVETFDYERSSAY